MTENAKQHGGRQVLSAERLASIQEVFSLFDKDNDDAIPTRQVAAVLRSVGYNPAEQQVRDLLEKYDPEGESMIDFPTFLELMQDVKRDGDSEAEIEEAFLVFDPHKSGVISASDMRHIMMNLGEKLSEEEATDMVVFADSSGTGEIRYRELMELMLE